MSDARRVNADNLDWDDDLRVLDGTPYSGSAFLLHPDGSLAFEVTYRDGFEEGVCREWHPNGKLKLEWFAERGRATGRVEEWHPGGRVKSVGVYESGVEILYEEWDESGNLVAHRQIDENTALFDYVRSMRRASS
jgi:antitoxin component YwqK of YwqJK toxin-antitoxin module